MFKKVFLKRLLVFFIIGLALFYGFSGIYFYKKAFQKKEIAQTIEIPVMNIDSELVILKDLEYNFDDENKSDNFPLSAERSFSGKKSTVVLPEKEYSVEIAQSFSEIPSLNYLQKIELNLKIWNNNLPGVLTWVLEIDGEDGKVLQILG